MIAEYLTADLRSRAAYLPMCPLCSHCGVHDFPDMLIGPSLRQFGDRVKVVWCCAYSEPDGYFDSEAEASQWWRQRRTESHPDLATNQRRLLTLARLKDRNLEAIESA